MLWSDLKQRTFDMVNANRSKRGAPDKPVKKHTSQYEQEFKAGQELTQNPKVAAPQEDCIELSD